MSEQIRFLIAASGSGGHLFPAVFIAEALSSVTEHSGKKVVVSVEFIGSGRPLEAEIIDKRGYMRHVYAAAPVKGKGPLGLLRFFLKLPANMLQVYRLLRSYKPHMVIGVGGYVSVLPVVIASLLRIPTWIHEAELEPGMANRVLTYFTKRVSVVS